MKPRHLAMLAALVIAVWLGLFSDKTADADLAEPVTRSTPSPASPSVAGAAASPRQTGNSAARKQAERAPAVLALRLREPQIAEEKERGDAGDAEDAEGLFSSKAWVPAAVAAAAKQAAAAPVAPSAPPLPFKYVGQQAGDGQLEMYLSRGDQVFVVREHSVIEGTYRVDSIDPQKLILTYLPLNQMQNLSTGVTD